MSELDRYQRQMLLPQIGAPGQERLRSSHAFIAGCGALGCMAADELVRAGVGRVTIIDRDVVERTNLQRQMLFSEKDANDCMPKAEAARRRLGEINSDVEIVSIIDDLNPGNLKRHLLQEEVHVLVDGLDNFETRYLLNDASVRYGIPYVYGGAVASNGMAATFLPRCPADVNWDDLNGRERWSPETEVTPCLRCVFAEAPPPGASPTCDTAGVLGPIVNLIASVEAAEAIKVLLGRFEAVSRDLLMIDLWSNESRRLQIDSAMSQNGCACCGQGSFEYLEGRKSGSAVSLCGRNSVQIIPATGQSDQFEYEQVAGRFVQQFAAHRNEFMTKARITDQGTAYEISLFPNGRAVITGTDDVKIARSIYARFVGS